jgi:hypothetical protein
MLACACITSLGFKVPTEIDQLAIDQFYTEISAEPES